MVMLLAQRPRRADVETAPTSIATASSRPAITTTTSTTIGMVVVPNVVGKTLAAAGVPTG